MKKVLLLLLTVVFALTIAPTAALASAFAFVGMPVNCWVQDSNGDKDGITVKSAGASTVVSIRDQLGTKNDEELLGVYEVSVNDFKPPYSIYIAKNSDYESYKMYNRQASGVWTELPCEVVAGEVQAQYEGIVGAVALVGVKTANTPTVTVAGTSAFEMAKKALVQKDNETLLDVFSFNAPQGTLPYPVKFSAAAGYDSYKVYSFGNSGSWNEINSQVQNGAITVQSAQKSGLFAIVGVKQPAVAIELIPAKNVVLSVPEAKAMVAPLTVVQHAQKALAVTQNVPLFTVVQIENFTPYVPLTVTYELDAKQKEFVEKNMGVCYMYMAGASVNVWENVEYHYSNGELTATIKKTPSGTIKLAYVFDKSGEFAAPGDLRVSDMTVNSATIKWDKVPGAKSYEVYRAVNDGDFVKVYSGSKTSYKATKLSIGVTYKFKVRGIKKDGKKSVDGNYSPIISVVTKLGEVTNLNVALSKSNTAKVSWKAVKGVNGYSLERAVNGGAFETVYGGRGTSYTDKNIAMGSSYEYRVRPYQNAGADTNYGEYSPTVAVQPKLAAVTGGKAGAVKSDSLTVSWKKLNGATGYEVSRSTDGYTYNKVYTSTDGKSVKFTDTGLTPKTKYYYKVRAVCQTDNGTTYGPDSKVIKATTKK